ncbi:hypothetical protein [Melittangium boletus]|uniref:hypothetical protein n=1 Tax=Melittangium boletus TaxID=83453 RepID=UPI003DA20739
MRTKLCVLGAVLGSASVLPAVCVPPEVTRGLDVSRLRERASPRVEGPTETPAAVPAGPALDGPRHPCELITVMQVPCDPALATCEYTYWECPPDVLPLRA